MAASLAPTYRAYHSGYRDLGASETPSRAGDGIRCVHRVLDPLCAAAAGLWRVRFTEYKHLAGGHWSTLPGSRPPQPPEARHHQPQPPGKRLSPGEPPYDPMPQSSQKRPATTGSSSASKSQPAGKKTKPAAQTTPSAKSAFLQTLLFSRIDSPHVVGAPKADAAELETKKREEVERLNEAAKAKASGFGPAAICKTKAADNAKQQKRDLAADKKGAARAADADISNSAAVVIEACTQAVAPSRHATSETATFERGERRRAPQAGPRGFGIRENRPEIHSGRTVRKPYSTFRNTRSRI